jgi:hypothetical protein
MDHIISVRIIQGPTRNSEGWWAMLGQYELNPEVLVQFGTLHEEQLPKGETCEVHVDFEGDIAEGTYKGYLEGAYEESSIPENSSPVEPEKREDDSAPSEPSPTTQTPSPNLKRLLAIYYKRLVKVLGVLLLILCMFEPANLAEPLVGCLVIPLCILRLGNARITVRNWAYIMAIISVPTAVIAGLVALWRPEIGYMVALGVQGFFLTTQDAL